MTQFKVGDEVQLVRDRWEFKRRTKAIVDDPNERGCYAMIKGRRIYFDNTDLKPYVKRKRAKAPTKSDISKLRQEIAIRNDAIDRLENDVRILQSEKVRLGETNAWLTEQNDALRKEVFAADETIEKHRKTIRELLSQNADLCRQIGKQKANYDLLNDNLKKLEGEQASNALRLYIYKTAFFIAAVVAAVLGAIILLP